ncbi:hypothetical protein AUP68_16343 [Ilyonectria robusta]
MMFPPIAPIAPVIHALKQHAMSTPACIWYKMPIVAPVSRQPMMMDKKSRPDDPSESTDRSRNEK